MPELIQNYRYMIVPAEGGPATAHTRATTHAKTLDDEFALKKWSERMVALGLAQRPDLVAQVAASEPGEVKLLDSLVVEAREVAGASKGAKMGDALHKMTERFDRGGLTLAQVGELYRADVGAYVECLAREQFSVEMIEEVVVLPELRIAGKLDRTVVRDGDRAIGDIKTGQRLNLQVIAAQLAIYAHGGTIYDHPTQTHRPMPPVNQKIGYVFHVPAGSGECRCIALDLEVGWRGVQLATFVRDFRRAPVIIENAGSRRDWLKSQIVRLRDDYPDAATALAAQWPLGVPTLKTNGHQPEQLDAIVEVLQRVEGMYRVPFGEPDPAPSVNQQREEIPA